MGNASRAAGRGGRSAPSAADDSAALAGEPYAAASRRPLQILLFLAPIIVIYELCLVSVLRAAEYGTITVEAHRAVLRFFTSFGITHPAALFLGGAVLVAVLLVWHVLSRDPWQASPKVALGMGVESVLLALPLLAIASLIAQGLPNAMQAASMVGFDAPLLAAAPPLATDAAPAIAPSIARSLAISLGAGLYEELFFRMILIAGLHALLVDVGRLPATLGLVASVIASAVAFALYHDLRGPDGALDGRRLTFFVVAGLYFGAVYAVRGYGLAVGVHAAYDVATVLGSTDPGV